MTEFSRRRGGQWKVNPVVTEGHAFNFKFMLEAVWDVGERLLAARTHPPISGPPRAPLGQYYRERLAVAPLPKLILEAVRHRDFPKRSAERQIHRAARG